MSYIVEQGGPSQQVSILKGCIQNRERTWPSISSDQFLCNDGQHADICIEPTDIQRFVGYARALLARKRSTGHSTRFLPIFCFSCFQFQCLPGRIFQKVVYLYNMIPSFFSILLSDFETKFCWIGVRRRHKLSLHEMLALLCATNDTVINHSVANCDTFSPYSCPHRNNHKELSLSRCIRLVAPHTF